MEKCIDTAKALLEEMASNNYHWSNERSTPMRGNDKYKVDAVTLLASRVDALVQRLDKVGTSSSSSGSSSGPSIRVYTICKICGMQGYASVECYNGFLSIEHVNVMYTFNLSPPQNNPYPNGDSPGGKSYSKSIIGITTLNLRMLCSHLDSSIKLPITYLHNPHSQSPVWRILQSISFRPKLIQSYRASYAHDSLCSVSRFMELKTFRTMEENFPLL